MVSELDWATFSGMMSVALGTAPSNPPPSWCSLGTYCPSNLSLPCAAASVPTFLSFLSSLHSPPWFCLHHHVNMLDVPCPLPAQPLPTQPGLAAVRCRVHSWGRPRRSCPPRLRPELSKGWDPGPERGTMPEVQWAALGAWVSLFPSKQRGWVRREEMKRSPRPLQKVTRS